MFKKTVATLICIILILWIAGYFVFISLSSSSNIPTSNKTTDAIIVLTGGGGHRISAGWKVFASGRAKHIFISGVHSSVTEKELLTLWKGITPLPKCCITLGRNATTTLENAQETKEWIEENNIKSIRLITSYYHMQRALIEFEDIKDMGIKIIPQSVEHTDFSYKDTKYWRLTFEEYNKILFRMLTRIIKI